MMNTVNRMYSTLSLCQKYTLFALMSIVTVFSIFAVSRSMDFGNHSHRFFTYVPRILGETTTAYNKKVMVTNKEYEDNSLELERRLKNATDKKIILIYYPPFGVKDSHDIDITNCGNCQVTYDRATISDPSTAAIVFHFNELTKNTMPSQSSRNPEQLHIFWTMESPPSLRIIRGRTLQFENEYHFNATMSYRLDSDFRTTYGQPTSKEQYYAEKLHRNLENILNVKSKTALTLVSNCGATPATSRRLETLKQVINLGFDLDAHGACFPGSASFPRGKEQQEATRKYKFYFSFENSYHCKNYITEKFFFNALGVSVVPVVRGATKEDYEAIAPPGSFIHYDDFSSTEELVNYLNYLDKNDTAYLEYFKWYKLKPEEILYYRSTSGFCQICRAVHGINLDDIFNSNYDPSNKARPLFTSNMTRRTIASLSKWFYDDNERACLTQQ